jgi:hypothetical protein
MTDANVIHIWDWYKPRKSDDLTTAIRRLFLRRKFKTGERVTDQTDCGTVIEVSPNGDQVKVLWDRSTRSQWHDVLDVQNS